MRVRIELTNSPEDEEVVIRCQNISDAVRRIREYAEEQETGAAEIAFYKLDRDTRQSEEFFFPVEEVLFFETEKEQVFAHTRDDAYRTKLRLYELEERLPGYFIRAAKSTIVNTKKIYSIKRDITQANAIQFAGTHKQVFASRRYYGAVKQRMKERHNYET